MLFHFFFTNGDYITLCSLLNSVTDMSGSRYLHVETYVLQNQYFAGLIMSNYILIHASSR